jgi:hypothetical protein
MSVGTPIQALHVRGIEYYAIERPCFIREAPTINPGFYIAWNKCVFIQVNVPPEDAEAICNVCNLGSLRNVKFEHLRKYRCVVANVSGQNQI